MKRSKMGIEMLALLVISAAVCAGTGWAESRSKAKANSSDRIYAQPVGSDRLSVGPSAQIEMNKMVNNEKDRAGVQVSACEGFGENSRCDEIVFVFPQLTVDQQNKRVLLGDEVVAKGGNFFHGAEIQEPFKLDYEIVNKKNDTGFNKYETRHVKVFLEKRANSPKR